MKHRPAAELIQWIVTRSCPGNHTNHFGCRTCSVSGLLGRANRPGCRAVTGKLDGRGFKAKAEQKPILQSEPNAT